jgi:hypothetical protein
MNPMTEQLQSHLVRDLQAFTREIEAFPDDAGLWLAPQGIANSAGNLALHVAGNLQSFVGAVLGGSGYQRDREGEFSRRSGTRQEVMGELDRALQAVETVLPKLTEEDLLKEFPITKDGRRFPTGVFLLRLAIHLAYHLGQTNYLRRLMTQTGPV